MVEISGTLWCGFHHYNINLFTTFGKFNINSSAAFGTKDDVLKEILDLTHQLYYNFIITLL